MKKLILILLICAGFSQLKAQQSITTQPVAPLTNGLTNAFKADTGLTPQQRLILPNSVSSNTAANIHTKNVIVYSNMPVLKLQGNPDNMPVAALRKGSDLMPLLKVTVMRPGDRAQTPAP